MNKLSLLYALQIIENNGGSSSICRLDYEMERDVTDVRNELSKRNFVSHTNNGRIEITEEGKNFLKRQKERKQVTRRKGR